MKNNFLLLIILPTLSYAMDTHNQLEQVKKIMNSDPNNEMSEIALQDTIQRSHSADLRIAAVLNQIEESKTSSQDDSFKPAQEKTFDVKSKEETKNEIETFKKKSDELKDAMKKRNRKLNCIMCALCPFTCGISLCLCIGKNTCCKD